MRIERYKSEVRGLHLDERTLQIRVQDAKKFREIVVDVAKNELGVLGIRGGLVQRVSMN